MVIEGNCASSFRYSGPIEEGKGSEIFICELSLRKNSFDFFFSVCFYEGRNGEEQASRQSFCGD